MPSQQHTPHDQFNPKRVTLETSAFKTPTFIAYDYCKQATDAPVLLSLHGLGSDSGGGKISAVAEWCTQNGFGSAWFDYPGHGQSGGEMVEFTISQGLDAALHMIDHVIQQPVVLMGSSTGGWLALLVAKARPDMVKGIVTVANACDYTEDLYWAKFSEIEKDQFKKTGLYRKTYANGFFFEVGYGLIEDGRQHLLFDNRSEKAGLGDITCPVRLLHGMEDTAVPWQTSVRIGEELGSSDVEVQLIPQADHRFSTPENIQTLCRAVASVYGVKP